MQILTPSRQTVVEVEIWKIEHDIKLSRAVISRQNVTPNRHAPKDVDVHELDGEVILRQHDQTLVQKSVHASNQVSDHISDQVSGTSSTMPSKAAST